MSESESSNEKPTILITNATNHVSSNLILKLDELGIYNIRTTVTDLRQPAAHAFKKRFPHLPVWHCEYEDLDSWRKALRGVDYVFMSHSNTGAFKGQVINEVRIVLQKRLLSLAIESDVKHIIVISDDLLLYDSWNQPCIKGTTLTPVDSTHLREEFCKFWKELGCENTQYHSISCGSTFGPMIFDAPEPPLLLMNYLYQNNYALPIKSLCSDVRDVVDLIIKVFQDQPRETSIILSECLWMKEVGEAYQAAVHESNRNGKFATENMPGLVFFFFEMFSSKWWSEVVQIQKYFGTDFDVDSSYAQKVLGRELLPVREAIKISCRDIMETNSFYSKLRNKNPWDNTMIKTLAFLLGMGAYVSYNWFTYPEVMDWYYVCSTCPSKTFCSNESWDYFYIISCIVAFMTIQNITYFFYNPKPLMHHQLRSLELKKQFFIVFPLWIADAIAFAVRIPIHMIQSEDDNARLGQSLWLFIFTLHLTLKFVEKPYHYANAAFSYLGIVANIILIVNFLFGGSDFGHGNVLNLYLFVNLLFTAYFTLASAYFLIANFRETHTRFEVTENLRTFYDYLHMAFLYCSLTSMSRIYFYFFNNENNLDSILKDAWFYDQAIFSIYIPFYFWYINRLKENQNMIVFTSCISFSLAASTYIK